MCPRPRRRQMRKLQTTMPRGKRCRRAINPQIIRVLLKRHRRNHITRPPIRRNHRVTSHRFRRFGSRRQRPRRRKRLRMLRQHFIPCVCICVPKRFISRFAAAVDEAESRESEEDGCSDECAYADAHSDRCGDVPFSVDVLCVAVCGAWEGRGRCSVGSNNDRLVGRGG